MLDSRFRGNDDIALAHFETGSKFSAGKAKAWEELCFARRTIALL